jgi:serine protease Do
MALSELEGRIAGAVESLQSSIVGVESLRIGRRRGAFPFAAPAQATGVVIDPAGFVITNQHVVENSARLEVHLADGRDATAEVVGGDPVTDVALLKLDQTGLVPAPLGDSEGLRVGQMVLAIGYALGLPGGPTVSTGVVSALARPLPGSDFIFEGLIQTDAAINPGNSGGPLVDLTGRVIGINTAMIPFAQGVGFAIPIHAVRRISDELRQTGRVQRAWIGVSVVELRPAIARQYSLEPNSGLLVAETVPRSPAHRAGLRPGDVIVRFGPFTVRRVRDLLEALSKFPVGSDAEVGFLRRGALHSSVLPLEESPAVAIEERGS